MNKSFLPLSLIITATLISSCDDGRIIYSSSSDGYSYDYPTYYNSPDQNSSYYDTPSDDELFRYKNSSAVYAGGIYLDDSLGKSRQDILKQDIEKLASDYSNYSSLNSIFNDHLNSGANLISWLNKRVKYLFYGNFLTKHYDKSISVADTSYLKFPDQDRLPLFDDASSLRSESTAAVIMQNESASFYYTGKKNKALLEFQHPYRDEIKITIDSPRAGIISVQSGWDRTSTELNPNSKNSAVNFINRISVLFHEAKHSDGHAENLAYFHSLCPNTYPGSDTKHSYAGMRACDKMINGPYRIQVELIKVLLKKYSTELNIRGRTLLEVVVADYASRIIYFPELVQDNRLKHTQFISDLEKQKSKLSSPSDDQKIMDELRSQGELSKGVKLSQGGTLKVELMDAAVAMPVELQMDKADNRILALAISHQRHQPRVQVIFVTKDINLRVKADAIGIKAVDYEPAAVEPESQLF